jgi:hypothetical protein
MRRASQDFEVHFGVFMDENVSQACGQRQARGQRGIDQLMLREAQKRTPGGVGRRPPVVCDDMKGKVYAGFDRDLDPSLDCGAEHGLGPHTFPSDLIRARRELSHRIV